MDSQNVFEKLKVQNAAKRILNEINSEREQIKATAAKGMKQFVLFGRELTVEEAWERATWHAQMLVKSHRGRQEMVVERILAVAEHCVGDTINLSADDFWQLKEQW